MVRRLFFHDGSPVNIVQPDHVPGRIMTPGFALSHAKID